jgi:dTDP-4-dehydrorhamnose reductase
MRVYLTGADGMLGTALAGALRADPATADWPLLGVSIADFDVADAAAVHDSIAGFRPDVVVHAAAHAIVDDCEADPKLALRVNVAGVRNVVDACRRAGSRLIYISSDYVFDGSDTPPGGYRETDIPNPLSVYGLTKLAGERTSARLDDHLSVRTSWLFGGADERLDPVLATVRQAARGQRMRLIGDQHSLPTYADDVAEAIVFLLTRELPVTGTIHAANAGTASWHEVAEHVLSLLDPALAAALAPERIALDDCAFLGERPRDSTLNTDRLAALGHTMPSWRDAVGRFCDRLEAQPPRTGEPAVPRAPLEPLAGRHA